MKPIRPVDLDTDGPPVTIWRCAAFWTSNCAVDHETADEAIACDAVAGPLPDYSEFLTPARLREAEEGWAREKLHVRNAAWVIDAEVLVEVGCGTGLVGEILYGEGVDYIGVDKNPLCLDAAGQRVPPGRLLKSDVRASNLADRIGKLARRGEHQDDGDTGCDSVASFAFLKHFAKSEWADVFQKVLSLASDHAFFDILLATGSEYVETGEEFPHLWVPAEHFMKLIAHRWNVKDLRIVHTCDIGAEVLVHLESNI